MTLPEIITKEVVARAKAEYEKAKRLHQSVSEYPAGSVRLQIATENFIAKETRYFYLFNKWTKAQNK